MFHIKPAILAQNTPAQERKISLRWLVALSSIPLFGIVAAFGIAPGTDMQRVPVQTVIENLDLPDPAQPAPDGTYWREEKIQRGDTIASLLERLDVGNEEITDFLRSTKNTKGIRLLIPGRTVRAETAENGELLALRYISSSDNMLQVDKEKGTFKARDHAVPLEQRVLMKSGEIKSSLFAATDAANIPDNIAVQLADVFSSDIDFHLDLRKGDHFTVVYEVFYNNGEPVKTGQVLAAEFSNQGKIYRAVYFHDHDGHSGYFTPDGKSLRKAFLRSPLEFSRITSGFTNARFHPVLQEWRAHKGIDYGAPIGTRVKATADATVEFVGKQGGYGNMIVLKHQGQFNTVYGHLSGFAKGLHNGSKVGQGDVIGFVGMTGLATGPHLHYEFKVAGVQRNPLSVALPTALPIAAQNLADFTRQSKQMMARLELLRNTNLAALD